jgi:hypothetical protein
MSPSQGHSGSGQKKQRSSDKTRTKNSSDRSRSSLFSAGPSADEDAGHYDRGYVLRQRIFLALVVSVLGLGVWIVATSMRDRDGSRSSLLSLSDSRGFYTVMVRELPESERKLAKKLSDTPRLISLAGEYRLFVLDVSEDRIGLCVGRFSNKKSPALEELCGRFREFKCDGRYPFESAHIFNTSE